MNSFGGVDEGGLGAGAGGLGADAGGLGGVGADVVNA